MRLETVCEEILERFGLTWAVKGIAYDGFDEIQHSDRGSSIGFDPVFQVFLEYGMKDGCSLTLVLHRASLAVIERWPLASFFGARHDAGP